MPGASKNSQTVYSISSEEDRSSEFVDSLDGRSRAPSFPVLAGDDHDDYFLASPAIRRSHWGQGVVFWSRTLQVHCKEMDNVPGKNPPSTLQTHSEFSKLISLQNSGTENGQYIHSVPVMFPLDNPWVRSEFSQRK